MTVIGATPICRMCGKALVFTGKYWEHVDGTPRHPATPVANDAPQPADAETLRAAILQSAIPALEFYAKQVYTHRMGLPPEVQWVAENALDVLRTLVREHQSSG